MRGLILYVKAKVSLDRIMYSSSVPEAISHESKTSCAERKEARTKACEEGECKIDSAAQSGNKTEGLPVTK
jgi:hypothetical protein